ncbi:MAG: four helix bundle protein [Phycisphaerae bacterium]
MGRIQGDLLERTFELAVAILRLARALPNNAQGWEVGRQLIRSGTSIGANVREADHALTRAEFAHKCSIARKEASETHYWLQLCQRTELLSGQHTVEAITEADELLRILSTVVKRTQERSAEVHD